mmetsp:Transcript_57636/g.146312  ORF Transcript_57636/g.146312 Transcript_57636/m.146312 type:complete len:144 (-) Transcript_57636:17-448(-)
MFPKVTGRLLSQRAVFCILGDNRGDAILLQVICFCCASPSILLPTVIEEGHCIETSAWPRRGCSPRAVIGARGERTVALEALQLGWCAGRGMNAPKLLKVGLAPDWILGDPGVIMELTIEKGWYPKSVKNQGNDATRHCQRSV